MKIIYLPLIMGLSFILIACSVAGSTASLQMHVDEKLSAPTSTSESVITYTPGIQGVDEFFAACPSADDIASVDRDLTLTFEYDPTEGSLACKASEGSANLTTLQKRVYLSILAMRKLNFTQPLPWTDMQLYDWFVDAVDGIRFRGEIGTSFCCEPENILNVHLDEMSFLLSTDLWIDPSMGGGLMDSLILFVHEARHNNGLAHTCPDNCSDRTISEMGAWAVQMYLEEWIAQYSDGTFLTKNTQYITYYREITLADSVDIRHYRFCTEPTITPGALPTLAP